MFSLVQLIALAVAAVAVFAAPATQNASDLPADCARNYTVRLGDTCDIISAEFNTSTYQLAYVNPNIDAVCDNLALGEPLCLGVTGQDCTDTYVVQSGDNCVAIAETAGTTYGLVIANNPNVNGQCTNIYPGEVLCVANATIPYTN